MGSEVRIMQDINFGHTPDELEDGQMIVYLKWNENLFAQAVNIKLLDNLRNMLEIVYQGLNISIRNKEGE